MKRLIYASSMLLLAVACSTIEDRDTMGPKLSPSQLVFQAKQPTDGSNTIILDSHTPGSLAYWDWGTGYSSKAQDTIYIPFGGKVTIKYTAFTAGGAVTDSTTVTIAKNDDAFFDTDPAWKVLTNGGAGQTWVWALDIPSGNIAGNGPEDCLIPTWWTMTPDSYGQSPKPLTDEVYMDLQGAANFQWKKPDGSIQKGFFKVVAPYSINGKSYSAITTIGGVTFPWPTSGKYHFTKMTADELAVHDYGQYNIAMYKRKGFNY